MNIVTFDLSSKCIGVIAGKIENKNLTLIRSCPIIPPKFNVEGIGFLKSKKDIKNGRCQCYVFAGENIAKITLKECRQRNVLVRQSKNRFILRYISEEINDILGIINPTLVLVERNECFNGVLTTKLLGEVMGTLYGVCGSQGIPIEEYPVNLVRKEYNCAKLCKELCIRKSEEELMKIPDITKRAIREMLEAKYGFYKLKFQTDDESDACLIFDYWLRKKGYNVRINNCNE